MCVDAPTHSRPGQPAIRIAVVGKGGCGKSTLAGTLCRVLASRGERVLALDGDAVPGLAYSIGVPATDDAPLSECVLFEEGQGFRSLLTPREMVERFARRGPRGIRFLQSGKPARSTTREIQQSASAFLEIVQDFRDHGWVVLTDLSAGTRQPYFGWAGSPDVLLIVVEPSMQSLMTARRMVRLTEEAPEMRLAGVANKVSASAQRGVLQTELERIGIPYLAEVPLDPALAEAERRGVPPVDLDPRSPGVEAVRALAERLVAQLRGTTPGTAEKTRATVSSQPEGGADR